jgi:nucleoside-diphosphate-sugar epimerase
MTLKNKTVLITGADGFIGSRLAEAPVKEGAKVKALSCYNSLNYWEWLKDREKYLYDKILEV